MTLFSSHFEHFENLAKFDPLINDTSVVQERPTQLVKLEEDKFIAGFHQQVQKE
jgi:hypothetical protein